ncbi:MAG: nicotinate (nicotinamide) nucleotide adenylyltransferase [Planctomycetota bacterium]
MVLFGGVFDPVHVGHIRLADHARVALPGHHVVFLPAGLPPHKQGAALTPSHHRARMLELAIVDHPGMSVDDRELRRSGPSFTVVTLEELHEERPGRHIYFLLGADNVSTVGHWHRAARIFELCDPVIVPRPGFPARFDAADVPFLGSARVHALNALALASEELAVSSSEVRRRAARGESLAGWVPAAVEAYIEEHRLYREG